LVGVGGAARLNEFVHAHLPKTYLAIGKLGIQTETGDWQGKIKQTDEGPYGKQVISQFDLPFLKERLHARFLGRYFQVPPVYSATKFQGRPLHEWARQGVEIKKEPVEREIYRLELIRWSYPYLSFRVTVSSGTYIRTLFEDMAQELGSLGHLIGLVRESIGGLHLKDSLRLSKFGDDWEKMGIRPEDALKFERIQLPEARTKAFLNGLPSQLWHQTKSQYAWVIGPDQTNWGLVERSEDQWKTVINFRALSEARHGH
jgi:tRNA pseudouridine55 synthase